jgi:hypothetical protein
MGFFDRLLNKSDKSKGDVPVNSIQSMINDWSSHVFGLAQLYNIELDYSEENIDRVSRMIGSYLGEVIIKYIGGKWNLNNNKVISISFINSECYPIGKVYKRLKIGNEESISFYYTVCKNEISKL